VCIRGAVHSRTVERDNMTNVQGPPFHNQDDGIARLIAHWEAHRKKTQLAAINASQGIVPNTGNLSLSGLAPVVSTASIPFERVQGKLDAELILQAQIVVLGDKTQEGQLIQGVRIPWYEIIREYERDPDFIFRLKPRQFEELIAGAYEKAGYSDVILTPLSGDRGRDVIVTATLPGIGTIRIVDQVKRYERHHRVNADEVRA
jgi:hypothetical protein